MKVLLFVLCFVFSFARAEAPMHLASPSLNWHLLDKPYADNPMVNYHQTNPRRSVIFPDMSLATRVVEFDFRANSAALYRDHTAMIFPVYTNALGNTIYRGIIIGTTTNDGGSGCGSQGVPTVYFESFNLGKTHRKPVGCAQFHPNRTYKFKFHVSRNWIYYKVTTSYYGGAAIVVVDSAAIDATALWGMAESVTSYSGYNRFDNFVTEVVENPDSRVIISNINLAVEFPT